MERRNFFEMLGLDFDPPEKDGKKIQTALSAKKELTEGILANETNFTRRSALAAELDLYDEMATVLGDTAKRNIEARALKEKRVAQLEQLIDIMLVGQTGTPEVTNSQIRAVSIKLKLKPSTIEDIYSKKGYLVRKKVANTELNSVFLNLATIKEIAEELSKLQLGFNRDKNQQIFFPWISAVTDLYSLACYFCDGKEEDFYRKKRTTELYSIMEVGAQKFVGEQGAVQHALAELFTLGQTKVFDSESSRKKYDSSLRREELRDFFSLLKSAPSVFKKDHFFAENCINTIQKHFSDYNLALALYNQEAGLVQDPYEPMDAFIHVICSACKTPVQFRTHEEAECAKCAVCGADYYVECPMCKHKVPAAADRCACGFLIFEMHFFEEYFKAAQFALNEKKDLAEARKQLTNAENAYPGQPSLIGLRKQIQLESIRNQKPLDDLQALILEGMFSKAQILLSSISASMPQLRLDIQRKLISEKLEEARRRMPSTTLSSFDAGNRCMEILQVVRDYQPALDKLRSIRFSAPKDLRASTRNTPQLTCVLTWMASGDRGITYRVVRKKDGIPKQYADGETLASRIRALEFKDTSLQPGIEYGYAVFACRDIVGVYSEPATCEVVNYSELDSSRVQATSENGVCHFSWVLPANCLGVRILRSNNMIPGENPGRGCIVVVNCASANYNDTDIINNSRYGYRLQCVYPYNSGYRYSQGQTMMLMPEEPPQALRNVSIKVEGRLVVIRWTPPDTAQRTVIVREVVGSAAAGLVGRVILASEINSMLGSGRTFATTTSSASQCQFEVAPNTFLDVAVISISGSKGIVSEIVTASSVEKCEINRNETRIEGGRMKIILIDCPKNLEMIHYQVVTKSGSSVPWASPEEARRGTLLMVSATDYIRDGMILVEYFPKEELYISVIGQYKMPNGSVAYSEPSKIKLNNKPKEKIKYRLTWGSGGIFSSKTKPKGCKLYVLTDATDIPQMKLVYRSDGHIPMKLLDPKTITLYQIPESESGFANGRYVYEFPDSTWSTIKAQTELRLMISENDMAGFELISSDISSLKIPQG